MESNGTSEPPKKTERVSRHAPIQRWLRHHPQFRIFIALVGVIMLWRGIWAFADGYFFPNHPLASFLGSIVIGLFLLLIDDLKLTEIE